MSRNTPAEFAVIAFREQKHTGKICRYSKKVQKWAAKSAALKIYNLKNIYIKTTTTLRSEKLFVVVFLIFNFLKGKIIVYKNNRKGFYPILPTKEQIEKRKIEWLALCKCEKCGYRPVFCRCSSKISNLNSQKTKS